jgi:hypothetical protein
MGLAFYSFFKKEETLRIDMLLLLVNDEMMGFGNFDILEFGSLAITKRLTKKVLIKTPLVSLKKFTFHHCRHSAASSLVINLMLRSNLEIESVASLKLAIPVSKGPTRKIIEPSGPRFVS